jgi:hypothetical protein
MKVPYLTQRGEIYTQCQAQVTEAEEDLANGKEITITINRQDAGYTGEIIVAICEGNDTHFDTNWSCQDVTRFPARIRNAATVLHDEGLYDMFRISHCNSTIRIRKL